MHSVHCQTPLTRCRGLATRRARALPGKSCLPAMKRARGMPGANAPAAWCAHNGFSESAHQYSQRKHRNHPASPTQWSTDYTRSSRGPLAVLTPSVRDTAPRSPVGLRATSANLDADHGAPEPHDFSVRDTAARLARRDRSRVARPAITSRTRQRRVHHSPPRVRDDRDTPLSVGRDDAMKTQFSENRKKNIFRARAGQDFARAARRANQVARSVRQ